jgi:hypothetical protein
VWLVTVIFMALFCFTETFSTIIILIEAAVLAWSIVDRGHLLPVCAPADLREVADRTPEDPRSADDVGGLFLRRAGG